MVHYSSLFTSTTFHFRYLHQCAYLQMTVVYCKITPPCDSAALQNDLDSINKWCGNSQMSPNVNKCKHMRFSRSTFQTSSPLTLNAVPPQQTDTYKYIGGVLTKNLSWDSHINSVVSAANQSRLPPSQLQICPK